MKGILLLLLSMPLIVYSQYDYAPSNAFPYGQANPKAPDQIKDFESLIGLCDCKSITKKQDGSWAAPVDMTWKWEYILNGMAVRDETLKSDGTHSGSIRQYSADSSRWYVHYYTNRTTASILPVWEGNKKEDKIILYRDQKAPNGMDGYYRLTFYDITATGFEWIGEWVDKAENIVFPTWKISCTKQKD